MKKIIIALSLCFSFSAMAYPEYFYCHKKSGQTQKVLVIQFISPSTLTLNRNLGAQEISKNLFEIDSYTDGDSLAHMNLSFEYSHQVKRSFALMKILNPNNKLTVAVYSCRRFSTLYPSYLPR